MDHPFMCENCLKKCPFVSVSLRGELICPKAYDLTPCSALFSCPLLEPGGHPKPSDFSAALIALKDGHAAARRGWNGKGMYLKMQLPDEHSKMGLPYIYISTVEGKFVPWVASQTDLLANDWIMVKIKETT